MYAVSDSSDGRMLDLLRHSGPLGISELVDGMGVTATAVRQRLSRLSAQGLVERSLDQGKRGRPSHRYRLTEKAARSGASNFADLALVLWEEVRAVREPETKRGLLSRIAARMAGMYRDKVRGGTFAQRAAALAGVFADRGIPIEARPSAAADELPVLAIVDCPYPELAEKDRGICAVERMLFGDLLQQEVRLTQCRLDGHACCEFASR
jgi:predicted ArsR family transcriptional regulator